MKAIKDVYNGWNDDGNLKKIKTCPFCGGTGMLRDNGFEEPEIDPETGAYIDMYIEEGDVFWCECEKCRSMGEEADTPEGAISNWNRRAGRMAKVKQKILFPVKCIAAVIFSPLLLLAVGALLVMRYEDQLLD